MYVSTITNFLYSPLYQNFSNFLYNHLLQLFVYLLLFLKPTLIRYVCPIPLTFLTTMTFMKPNLMNNFQSLLHSAIQHLLYLFFSLLIYVVFHFIRHDALLFPPSSLFFFSFILLNYFLLNY